MTAAATEAPLGPRPAFWAGARSVAPILIGVLPFGMVYGVTSIQKGIGPTETLAMSLIIFAGASQIVFAELWHGGVSTLVLLATVWIVNLRMMMYSASLAPHFGALSRRWKLLITYLLTDQAYAVSIVRYHQGLHENDKRWYYLGAAASLWSVWQLSSALGVLVGAGLPKSWALDFTIPLTFLTLLLPSVRHRAHLFGAVVAGTVAVAAHGLPWSLGLIVGAVAGTLAGAWLQEKAES